jgi:hypothetical protein
MLGPDDPMSDPANRTLLKALAVRLAAGYATLPGKEADAQRWTDIAFRAAASPHAGQRR